MATFNLVLTYPDADQTRVLDALRAHYATNAIPSPTNAQVVEALRKDVINKVKGIVLDAEQRAAATTITVVSIT